MPAGGGGAGTRPAHRVAPDRWDAGDRAVLRFVRGGTVHAGFPTTVVDDGPDGLLLWVAEGAPVERSHLADGRALRDAPLTERFTAPRRRRLDSWRGPGCPIHRRTRDGRWGAVGLPSSAVGVRRAR